jgi:hypothetical protein
LAASRLTDDDQTVLLKWFCDLHSKSKVFQKVWGGSLLPRCAKVTPKKVTKATGKENEEKTHIDRNERIGQHKQDETVDDI